MSTSNPITIVGGGLAGLTLGIGLRQRGVPVTVHEAGHYPRHRVCGEFISGRGLEALRDMGLEEVLLRAGAGSAYTAAFFLGRASSPVRQVRPAALCLSRFRMDAVLAAQFCQSGGVLRENSRWRDDTWAAGTVRASGRRLERMANGQRWLGLKVHARTARLDADLEMHGFQDGYVGLCRLPGTEVNVCGLFRRPSPGRGAVPPWQEMLRGTPGSALRMRLGNAEYDESSFCSVAGFSLGPHRAAARTECCVGDALTMIPPVTGNGMSMAFESARMALEPLAAWSRGRITWLEAQQRVAVACDEAFAQRLAWARWLQWLMFLPVLRTGFGNRVLRSEWVWRTLFTRTR